MHECRSPGIPPPHLREQNRRGREQTRRSSPPNATGIADMSGPARRSRKGGMGRRSDDPQSLCLGLCGSVLSVGVGSCQGNTRTYIHDQGHGKLRPGSRRTQATQATQATQLHHAHKIALSHLDLPSGTHTPRGARQGPRPWATPLPSVGKEAWALCCSQSQVKIKVRPQSLKLSHGH